MITLVVTADEKGPLYVEKSTDGKSCTIGGYKFDHWSKLPEGMDIQDGPHDEISFACSKFRDSYQLREILSATPIQKTAKADTGSPEPAKGKS